jgi:hypothetical protein
MQQHQQLFQNADLLSNTGILSFVGHNQYRFVATINHKFHTIYLQLFPNNKRTHYNISTIEHTKISLEYTVLQNLRDARLSCLAARYGCISTLKYAQTMGFQLGRWTWENAALYGQLHILQYGHANGYSWQSSHIYSAAAAKGHLHVIQWSHMNGFPWDDDDDKLTCYYAAINGHLEVLQYAHSNCCPWDFGTCCGAARYGYLEILQWARSKGCPWDHHTCQQAAENGHLDVLQWAKANGCPWDKRHVAMQLGRGI